MQGCRVRDHVVNVPQVNPGSEGDLQTQLNKVYDDLLVHRDVICVPYQRLSDARYWVTLCCMFVYVIYVRCMVTVWCSHYLYA